MEIIAQDCQAYSWAWVEESVAGTIAVWDGCAPEWNEGVVLATLERCGLPHYELEEQQRREAAYDEAMLAVERELKTAPLTSTEQLRTQERVTAAFARFSAAALDLDGEAVELLTNDFLPVGTGLARWARTFDPGLSMADIIQACRNAWTACGMQPLLGEKVRLTLSVLGYSLLYPYSDNYLDRVDISAEHKMRFSRHFRGLLRGELVPVRDFTEEALLSLIELIEGEYPRLQYPQVFECLLAIHRAQEESICQLDGEASYSAAQILQMSCAKGGTSVLADACLARGSLTEQESGFAFQWGVLLQLGDDLQDVKDDVRRGSATLFSRAAELGEPLDALVIQLLNFSDRVAARMDELPHGSTGLKELLRMSWRSLILRAVGDSHEYFSPGFLELVEPASPFRFSFLRSRNERLTSQQGLYATLFQAFLERSKDTAYISGPPDHRESGLDGIRLTRRFQ
ncbi:MAG TPA: hypothetical protein VGD64_07040 [Acidisarcina sp.]